MFVREKGGVKFGATSKTRSCTMCVEIVLCIWDWSGSENIGED